MISFQAKYLRSIFPFIATNEIRYYLSGIYIEPHKDGGAVLVATNGHVMMVVRDKTAYCSEPAVFTVRRDALKYCATKLKSKVTINPITQRLTISGGDNKDELYVQAGKCLIDAVKQYPKYQKVLPKFDDLKRAITDTINNKYLIAAANAVDTDSKYGNGMKLWQASSNGPVLVRYENAPEYITVIMPMRESMSDEKAIADWKSTFNFDIAEALQPELAAA